jgi:hypothetical protein
MGGLNSGPHRSARLKADRAAKFDAMAYAQAMPAATLRDGAKVCLSFQPWPDLPPVTASTELAEVRCGFGGRRWLLACPCCGRRARVLYGGRPETNARQRIACRACQRVRYPSQFESPERRWRRQLAKLEARLGGDPRKMQPPKGLARRTWNRLAARHQHYREKIAARRRDVLQGAMRGKLWPTEPHELQRLRERFGAT